MSFAIKGLAFMLAIAIVEGNSGWIEGGKYKFQVFSTPVTGRVAQQKCSMMGGRLASAVLRDAEAVKKIIDGGYVYGDCVRTTVVTCTDHHMPWIGLGYHNNRWYWLDFRSWNHATTAWNVGEPNGKLVGEYCGHIWTTSGGKVLLNDTKCNELTFTYICKK